MLDPLRSGLPSSYRVSLVFSLIPCPLGSCVLLAKSKANMIPRALQGTLYTHPRIYLSAPAQNFFIEKIKPKARSNTIRNILVVEAALVAVLGLLLESSGDLLG